MNGRSPVRLLTRLLSCIYTPLWIAVCGVRECDAGCCRSPARARLRICRFACCAVAVVFAGRHPRGRQELQAETRARFAGFCLRDCTQGARTDLQNSSIAEAVCRPEVLALQIRNSRDSEFYTAVGSTTSVRHLRVWMGGGWGRAGASDRSSTANNRTGDRLRPTAGSALRHAGCSARQMGSSFAGASPS